MDVETMVREFPIDEQLQHKVDALAADGWGLVPGTAPIAVYHLCRAKQQAEQRPGALGKLQIDDSLIFVQPAQKQG